MRTRTLCASILASATSLSLVAQNGPDVDPDAARGYVENVFHLPSIDSINLYNGQLTIPVPIGPVYPVGPKLKYRAMLAYSSRVWEFGNPGPNNQDPNGLYEPIVADPSLGLGWTFAAGAIKTCGVVQNSLCYLGPDGAETLFDYSATGFRKTADTSQLYLHDLGASGYEMWDGDGNHYVFSWHVTGYDDLPQDYVHDLGRGRNGWYLKTLTDPFGNELTFDYYTGLGSQPCWTPAHCPSATNSWILHTVKRGTATLLTVNLGTDPQVPGISNLVSSIDFAVFAGGVSTTARWSVGHDSFALSHALPTVISSTVVTIDSLQLPQGQYSFTYNTGTANGGPGGLLKTMALPTGGLLSYVWGVYSFYHGRTSSIGPNCTPLGPPNNADVKWSGRAPAGQETNQLVGGVDPDIPAIPNIAGTDCSPQNPNRWLDTVLGVIRRTETLGTTDSITDYAQYAFPFGERGSSPTNNFGPQTLTLVTYPADRDGRRNAAATLFWGARIATNGCDSPGDRCGADIRTASYDHDPFYVASPFPQPLCGGAADSLCVTHASRVTQRTYEYDNPTSQGEHRRLQQSTTYYGPTAADGSCPSCEFHSATYSLSGSNTWEGNGRHYNTETHSGSLGNDSRTIDTTWNAQTSPWLPNLYTERIETASGATGLAQTDRRFEFDGSTGFLRGVSNYDAGRQLLYLNCRYPDADGNLAQEFAARFTGQPAPRGDACSFYYSTMPTSIGNNDDNWGKSYTYQDGLATAARWISNGSPLASWAIFQHARDGTTGWITGTTDSAGITTSYRYDGLGRVTSITPPAPEAATSVSYPSVTQTTATRNGGTGLSTQQDYFYDGLGRLVRERRLMADGTFAKRFSLFDGPGHEYFQSEWVGEATPETATSDSSTTCSFESGSFTTSRPTAAPGTYRHCFDPFGRPQSVVGSRHSSYTKINRSDGSVSYSDTVEAVTTDCVNGTFSGGVCSGGTSSVTKTERDAFGRITSVVEPGNLTTSYLLDVNGKVTRVTQGSQTRTFDYDAAGFLRREVTPEKGMVLFDDVGVAGNVLQETQGDSVVLTRTYDFAGRIQQLLANGTAYQSNSYDGGGFAGGVRPKGKLTQRLGYNPGFPSTVTENFTYSGLNGRLSQKDSIVSGTPQGAPSASQTWTYNNLGLVAAHGHS
ncbi:MAG: hypothetical protein ACRD3M_17445, partial [Thermoanaerobaculia bacterium]